MQALFLFASLAILLVALQLIFQIWQVVLAKQQLLSSPTADTSKCRQVPLVNIIVLRILYDRLLGAWTGYQSNIVAVLVLVASPPFIVWLDCSLSMFMRHFQEEGMLLFEWTCVSHFLQLNLPSVITTQAIVLAMI
jgi:hypothetical protein